MFDADDALKRKGLDDVEFEFDIEIMIYIYKKYEVRGVVRTLARQARTYSIITRRNE